jgi:C4-dicarboxylate-binding protein DctP
VKAIRAVAAIALLALAATAGCSGGDKAGGSGGVVTLRLAMDDPRDGPSSEPVIEFARNVRKLSDGRLRVHVVWEANGHGAQHPRAFDQKTAQKVIDGRYALALVPTRAWDVFGVTSLKAIQAPFLVNNDALLDKIASDPVADTMLAGLKRVGVVGLALLPNALRHPVGFAHPLPLGVRLRWRGYPGATVRAHLGDAPCARRTPARPCRRRDGAVDRQRQDGRCGV